MDILSRSREIEDWVIGVRRRLHQCPELLYALDETSELVAQELSNLGVTYERGIADTGILARIGDGKGDCVMLRADMDALLILEESDIDFRSKNLGKMHACGHDCHTAMLLGAAKLLKSIELQI